MPMEKFDPITIPCAIPKEAAGFGLDSGGSLMKVTVVDRSKSNNERTVIQCFTIPNEEMKNELPKLVATWERTKEFTSGTIFVTGAGSNNFNKFIEDTLQSKTKSVGEFTLTPKILRFVSKNLPPEDVVFKISDEDIKRGELDGDLQHQVYLTVVAAEKEAGEPALDMNVIPNSVGSLCDHPTQRIQYPFLLVWCNSASANFLIKEDGSYVVMDTCFEGMANKAGFAVAKGLTGAKTFNEYCQLAEKGNSKNLDEYLYDIMNAGAEDDKSATNDLYKANAALDVNTYSMGKLVHKDIGSFAKEDIARSWMNMVAGYFAQKAFFDKLITGAKDVVFMGSVFNVPLMRKFVATKFAYNTRIKSYMHKKDYSDTRLHILKIGSHMGALGTLLDNAGMLKSPWI